MRLHEPLRRLLSSPESPQVRRAAVTALALVLLIATAAAFAVAERLKLERSPLTAPEFTRLIGPECACESARAALRIRLRKPERLDVSIVNLDGEHVRTLATDVARKRGPAQFEWDGRNDAGDVVRDGRYRVRFHLDRAGRTITVPTGIRVDATPPRLTLISAEPRTIAPGFGGPERVLFTYRTSERASPLLLVRSVVALRTPRSRPRGVRELRWRGKVGGSLVRPGSYRTDLFVVDLAGNRSEPASVTVLVRRS